MEQFTRSFSGDQIKPDFSGTLCKPGFGKSYGTFCDDIYQDASGAFVL
jgi:hypothetical protein